MRCHSVYICIYCARGKRGIPVLLLAPHCFCVVTNCYVLLKSKDKSAIQGAYEWRVIYHDSRFGYMGIKAGGFKFGYYYRYTVPVDIYPHSVGAGGGLKRSTGQDTHFKSRCVGQTYLCRHL